MIADAEMAGVLAAKLDGLAMARLGRSLAVFPVMGADCGACALEWAAVQGSASGLAGHGVCVVDHPAAADVLLVAGPMTLVLVDAVRRAFNAMGEPRWVVAVGDCGVDGGPFGGSYAVAGGVDAAVPVDMVVPGCPPEPAAMLSALLTVLAANAG